MNGTPEKQNAARGRGVQSELLQATSLKIIPELTDAIKSRLETGQLVRLVDYPERQRALALGILASLMDELPVRSRWTTLRGKSRVADEAQGSFVLDSCRAPSSGGRGMKGRIDRVGNLSLDDTAFGCMNFGFVPSEGVVVIAGKPGAGKSTAALQMAFALSAGMQFGGATGWSHCGQRGVYIALERAGLVRRWALAMRHFHAVDDLPLYIFETNLSVVKSHRDAALLSTSGTTLVCAILGHRYALEGDRWARRESVVP